MERSLNIATPFAATTDVVPPSVPPPGFAAIAIVMLRPLSVGTILPKLSNTCTVTAGLIACPTVVVVGCCPNPSLVAVPAVMLNATLSVVLALPVALSVLEPARLMLRLPNVAIPLASVDCVDVPLNVPVPADIDITTEALGTLWPNESFAWTVTAGVMVCPATVFVGCCTNATVFTAAALTVKALLSAESAPADAVSFFVPVRLMLRLLNVAIPVVPTPVGVVCVSVPLSVPDPLVSATAIDRLGTLLPNWSCALTDAVKSAPAATLAGG